MDPNMDGLFANCHQSAIKIITTISQSHIRLRSNKKGKEITNILGLESNNEIATVTGMCVD